MNDPLRPGLQPVSHLKAGPTTSSSRSTALPSSGQPPLTRPSSRLRAQRPLIRDDTTDATSDKATTALIRRVLYPQASSGHGASSPQPSEELLPPLTSSNDVDRQLYAILAVIIKEFVYSWYSKITPDQALVNEVLQVVAHCTRALEQRIRQVDVTQLALDEIPTLVKAHITSYRFAQERSRLSGLPTSHRAIYHEANPHPGLSPVPDPADPDTVHAQAENEAVYRRLLASGTLAVLLPTEDLENSSLRQLVSDILSDLILGKEVAGRVCQGWFLWDAITKVTEGIRRRETLEYRNPANDVYTNRLERFGLLADEKNSVQSHASAQSPVTTWIWSVLQNIYLGYVALRFIATGLFRVASSQRQGPSHRVSGSFHAATPDSSKKEGFDSSSSDGVTSKRPVLDYRVYSMISQLFDISQRMPWLSGLFALVQHLILAGPGRLGDTDGILDRFLRETIEEYVLPPTLLPNLLLATRSALFPANARPTSSAPTGNTTGVAPAPAPAPQVSVQPPIPSGKSPLAATVVTTSAPFAESSRVPGLGASDAVGKRNADSSNDSRNSNIGVGVGSGGNRQHAALPPRSSSIVYSSSPTTATTSDIDLVQEASTEVFTGPENRIGPSISEIAAIKRRCAASLLAVIPLNVARTLFGVPPPSSSDRTCSAATGNSSTTTISGQSPPSSLDGDGGGHLRCSLQVQGKETFSSPQASSLSSPASPSAGLASDNGDSRAVQRTDEQIEGSRLDQEELYFLQAIETDLLDLLADEYCNKHLVYSIIETVLARVLPELTEHSVQDLMEERGVAPVPGGF